MKESLETILENYKDLIRTKAGLYFMLGGDKDDIIQEGMIGLVKAYQTFTEDKGASFKTYASLCIDRQIVSAIRKANTGKNSPLNGSVEIPESHAAGPLTNPEDAAIYKDFTDILLKNENGVFSPFEHSVLTLLIDGKTSSEIAEKLGKTSKQIDNSTQRIKAKVKKLFQLNG